MNKITLRDAEALLDKVMISIADATPEQCDEIKNLVSDYEARKRVLISTEERIGLIMWLLNNTLRITERKQ